MEMTKNRSLKRTVRLGALSGVLAFVAWGCGDNTEEQLRAAKLAQGCSINSDCEDKLVCVFERCHKECDADRDCTAPLRCMRGDEDEGETNVCQLEDEIACERDKDCKGDQECGVDDECRDPCSDEDACLPGLLCAASGECASTDPKKDQLDENGNILRKESGIGGAPGAGGASGAGGSGPSGGGESVSGGAGASAGGTSGVAGDGATAGESTGSAGEAAGGSDPGPVAEYYETSDGVEPVNNNDREHAIPASPKSSLFFTLGDADWLKVSAPSDGRAHVVELELQQESGLRTIVEALAGADFEPIGSATTKAGVTTRIYVTVGPGTTTLLGFSPWTGVSATTGKRLELSIQMSEEQDEHEPNNTDETATSIEVNTPTTAQFINPFVSATSQAIDDWYSVDLVQGPATLALLDAPSDGRFTITCQNEHGVPATAVTPLDGVTGAWSFNVPATGTYFIHFARYTGFLPLVEGLKPSYASEPYVFEVQQ
jgi:hypothetical protein